MLNVSHLSFDYGHKPLLTDINFTLSTHRLLYLTGANGKGKSTLLRLLVGLFRPTAGDIFYANQPIYDDLPTYQQQLCYVGHKTGVNQLLTASEYCRNEVPGYDGHPMAAKFLQGINPQTLNGQLSAGQRRRLGLLRLLTTKAKLWLLDEPFVGLDKASTAQLTQLLDEHLLQGGQIILTSHQPLPTSQAYQEYCLG